MTALYIIGGIVLYLLIGSVMAYFVVSIEGKGFPLEPTLIIFFWGVFLIFGFVMLIVGEVSQLARRIGGVK